MKSLRALLCLSALVVINARAGEPGFPGLQAIMSEADWNKARLDRLDAADLKLINAAFAQYLKSQSAPPAEPAAATAGGTATTAEKPSLWSRFGLGKAAEKETRPAAQMMQARVKAMRGVNGFVLDNGQVWEGIDPIRDELAGREIGILEGRFGSFLLVVDGEETNVRLRRVR